MSRRLQRAASYLALVLILGTYAISIESFWALPVLWAFTGACAYLLARLWNLVR